MDHARPHRKLLNVVKKFTFNTSSLLLILQWFQSSLSLLVIHTRVGRGTRYPPFSFWWEDSLGATLTVFPQNLGPRDFALSTFVYNRIPGIAIKFRELRNNSGSIGGISLQFREFGISIFYSFWVISVIFEGCGVYWFNTVVYKIVDMNSGNFTTFREFDNNSGKCKTISPLLKSFQNGVSRELREV